MIVCANQLQLLRRECKNLVIVLATGTFDLFHYEHLKYLEDAKKCGDVLVVAVKDNKSAKLKGKGRPIIDEKQRIEIVDAIRYVDYTVLAKYDKDTVISNMSVENEFQRQWLQTFNKIFELLRPNILYYEINEKLQQVRNMVFDKYVITGISRERTAIVSTTKIISKINGVK